VLRLPTVVIPEYPEPKRRALARNVLRNSLLLKRGEKLLVETWSGTQAWAESLVLEARILGARPMLVVEDEATYWKGVEEAPASHIGQVGTHEWAALKACDAHVYLWGPYDTMREEALPPSVRNRIMATDHEWFRLVQRSRIRSIRWDLGRTSEVWADRYGVDLAHWRSELIEGATADPHPMRREGQYLARKFRTARTVRITHKNGTDLTLRLAGRPPRVDDGIIDDADVRAGDVVQVVPSGVTVVTVDERFADGEFISEGSGGAAFSSEFKSHIPLNGGRWSFRNGKLTDYSFERGGPDFRRAFRAAGPGKERPGLISVGLNPSTTSIPLLFDQEHGVVSLTVGRNHEMGGHTRGSRFVAYSSLRNPDLSLDGTPILLGGQLVGVRD
jgi:leucyl aminopeptidase (aminopeptidase T)